MARPCGEGRQRYDGHLRPACPALHFLPAVLLFSLALPSVLHAAWAVYADSWASPTQAQEQAIRINRTLNAEWATYERATVQGRVFWRVRVGVYRSRAEAQEVRHRLSDAGVSESWMREVPDEEISASPVLPTAAAPTRADTVRVDSVAQAIVDSVAMLTQRRVDSLETVSQQRLNEIMQRMRWQLAQELLEEMEESQRRDRAVYVTQAEQTQMVRALLDEMNSHLEVLRDSLRREREEQSRLAALLPHVSGSVAARTLVMHERPQAASRKTSAEARLSEARVALGWDNNGSSVLVDLRAHDALSVTVRQAYVTWTFSRRGWPTPGDSGRMARRVGLGAIEAPYGLESLRWDELLAPSPSQLTALRPRNYVGLWLVAHETRKVRLLVMPYGAWDEENQSGLAQARVTWQRATIELTGGARRGRDDVSRARDAYDGHLVAQWQGARWSVGAEGLFERQVEPAYGDTTALSLGLRRQVDTWGLLVLLHHRLSPGWGWTLRGDFITPRTTWRFPEGPAVFPAPGSEPFFRRGTITAGPMFFKGSRLRISFMYTFGLAESRPTGQSATHLDQDHRVEFAMSHLF